MKKINEKWENPIGIRVKIWFKESGQKEVRLQSTNGKTEFVFNKSNPETIKKVGKAFVEIAEFVENL